MRLPLLAVALLTAKAVSAAPTYGPELEGFDYPYPVKRHALTSQGQDLSMAFMDVTPERPNGRTVVLLHGKNFCAATWGDTAGVLARAGYRVLALDQVGFCKSTKPVGYQFSFNQLATNTHGLLAALGIRRATIVGHSMGGMLAARYALMFPDAVEQLVMVDPLGLEDWQQKGVPYQTIDDAYAAERKTSAAGIKAYQLKFYYDGQWKPEYDRWVEMQAGLYAGPGAERVAWNQAQTSDMVFTQPVVHEFDRLVVPTVLMVGDKDRTAPGANRAAPALAATLGRYDRLGPEVTARIKGARLVMFEGLGHSPQVEAPDRFHEALLRELAAR
ncbi:alpha/beta fold hydrolase [Methylobacterium frigidaeris]|uniref:2-hydroxy-6-oxo-6-phenylhexa-2,4-dienoate hydrolase n=1 Tax=Methylobacterium frigidaeris TaxID=2038277 RepID=A0AA37HF37_9HYPH|nr:alpha/beta hydrolase [Methylobacterium frigidaeris]PIK71347.1 alpha/beta hydrolase [Methylobacterium frigidaeris]GJD64861.1 2-hydroxy-6-oxo-6-phenylhexa-2,4-dienoate hydrolase [Methylobacterium frigidaeris]